MDSTLPSESRGTTGIEVRAARRVAPQRGGASGAARTPRLVVVANRLPVTRVRRARRAGEPPAADDRSSGEGGAWQSSAGGLVTAMAPVLRSMPGRWVGWTGGSGDVDGPFRHDGIEMSPVRLAPEEVKDFYEGMCNRTIWPLYHDAIRAPEFRRRWWRSYLLVNERYAEAASAVATDDDLVWVHDYHLQLVPALLRARRPDLRLGFFLHIPFPPTELFSWLPWRREILEGLLGADLVGFHTRAAATNFARLCRGHGLGDALKRCRAAAFPISVDARWFSDQAARESTRRRAAEIRRRVGGGRKILLAIDRLDYTKAIDRRLLAFRELLGRPGCGVEEVVLVQIATPSREAVPEYAEVRGRIDEIVGDINGAYSVPGRHPVHYFRRNLAREELVAWYLAADAMIVTPYRDGMNLVAKEFVACRNDGEGVLVLSEFAGAALELREALIVNPHDLDGLVEGMARALTMPQRESRRRMAALRRTLFRHDVHAWSTGFIEALGGHG